MIMWHRNFYFCNTHKFWTPNGRLCPQCSVNTDERQQLARVPRWTDIVPLRRRLEFMEHEHLFCRDEENEFNRYEGDDLSHKEELRTLVMEKRHEFLLMFMEIMKEERLKGEYKRCS